jgi:hypothetical protein
MFRRWIALPLSLLTFSASSMCQAVISTHSGLLNYFEGTVYIDNQRVEQKPGVFASVPNGSILRTERGRAELLLTPGTFLRLDNDSSLRMISNSLSATRIEVLTGSVILDSSAAAPDGTSAVLVYKNASVAFPRPGIYRLDTEPPVLQVFGGKAQVTQDGKTTTVDSSHLFFLELAMQTDKFGDGSEEQDDFYAWSQNRNQTIDQQNQIAQETSKTPDEEASSLGIPPDPDGLSGLPGLNSPGSLGPLANVPLTPSPYDFGAIPYNPAWGIYTSIPLTPYAPAPLFALIVPRYWTGVLHPIHTPSPLWHHLPWFSSVGVQAGTIGSSLWFLTHRPSSIPAASGWVGATGTSLHLPARSYWISHPGLSQTGIGHIGITIPQTRYTPAPRTLAAPHYVPAPMPHISPGIGHIGPARR